VAVRIGSEEEAGNGRVAVLEVDQLADGEAFGGEAGMFGIDIVDHHRQVSVAVAKIVGLRAPLVDGEFEFEATALGRHVDQGEVSKVEPIDYGETERLLVEGPRTL